MNRLERKRAQVAEVLEGGLHEGLTVEEVMTAEPSCIAAGTTALELVRLFHAHRFRHLLVAGRDGRLIGIISDRDVLRCLGLGETDQRAVLERITAAELMSQDLITIEPHASLERAVGLMLEHGISCLPVLRQERLVGILTNTDVEVVLELLLRLARQSASEQPFAAAVLTRHN
jgi:CBS domain-containing protein